MNVLFLCTGNSARSILAEATFNALAPAGWRAISAGSQPAGYVHPKSLALLAREGIATDGLHSKSRDEFAGPEAPHMDLIVTVCDNAAGEVCPVWPGHPASVHWGYPDPSEGDAPDDAKREAFRQTLLAMKRRLELLISLPPSKLERTVLAESARELAKH